MVKGLAVAISKPLVGMPTLEAMVRAFPHCPHTICPVIDARMKEVYAAWFEADGESIRCRSDDLMLGVADLLRGAKEDTLFFRPGPENYREDEWQREAVFVENRVRRGQDNLKQPMHINPPVSAGRV